MAGTRTEDGLKSLAKVMRVLDCFSTRDRSLTLGEISQRTGLPKATAHRLVASLREVGMLEQDRGREGYRLGLKLFELGNIVLANLDLHREARPFVEQLTRISGHSVHLAVFDGRQAVVIHRADPHPEGSPVAFIESAPAHCTSVGKAILAFQPEETLRRLAALGALVRYTDATLTDPVVLSVHLAETRERGWSLDEGEHQPGLRCVGAPIRDVTGRVFAAISVSAPSRELPVSRVPAAVRLVRHAAAGISAALGWRAQPSA
ncbi:IclR family transcriptional regulator [Roseomonas sp. AR75]|uniref:IclR family transcriptional regulator n=1 Tax=Roseomonas sp. AR75 TaxID=2562311 RepID=UPI0010C00C8D|nr:IclR family transcriptional regulator [Roseomonas sp. AR75]